MKTSRLFLKATSAAFAAAVLLSGCATHTVDYQPKANYKEFTDATWRPESNIRPPFRSTEMPVDSVAILQEGIYAFYDTHRSFFQLQPAQTGSWTVSETVTQAGERCFTWGQGAVQLIRNSRVLNNEGPMVASRLPDGRILLQNSGQAVFNLAVELRAYNISGKPIRHFLRNGNNQPDSLAWFVPADAKFPQGSVAYLATYWLGDDEIVQPSRSAFTGTRNLESMIARYTAKTTPYCMSYVSHLEATPYGLSFERPVRERGKNRASAPQGRFILSQVQRSNMFCERLSNGAQKGGSWKISRIQGTRVLELTEDADVPSSDIGIQPINNDGIDVGFAEIVRGNKGQSRMQVVPVRIVRNNQPVTDFRLKFNAAAAQAIAEVLPEADASRRAHDERNKLTGKR